MPLSHCQRADNPKKCKGDFPRAWLVEQPVVLCPGLMRRWDMALGGRRNRPGSLHGPRNEENVNATHPALAAFLQTNSDVQLPYRFAITAGTHAAEECQEACVEVGSTTAVIEAVQSSQDAQVGYACDYQNKRAARSCNEVKECVKGHRRLHDEVATHRPSYIGDRHTKRLLSDTYGRGIVRSNQESTNLRVYSEDHDVTAAESFHTAQTMVKPGKDLTEWREAIFKGKDRVEVMEKVEVDSRNPTKRKVTQKNITYMYGHRPCDCKSLWFPKDRLCQNI